MNEHELWTLEQDFWLAGAAAYEQRLATEALMVFAPPAGLLDRQATIAAVAQAPRWSSVDFAGCRAIHPTGSVSILAYEATAKRGDTGEVYKAQCSSTYVRVAGEWKLALHQQTPLPM